MPDGWSQEPARTSSDSQSSILTRIYFTTGEANSECGSQGAERAVSYSHLTNRHFRNGAGAQVRRRTVAKVCHAFGGFMRGFQALLGKGGNVRLERGNHVDELLHEPELCFCPPLVGHSPYPGLQGAR